MLSLFANPSLRLLFVAQALFWSCAIIGITLTSLVGLELAPKPELATLPLALLAVGNLGTVHFLSVFMQSHGRRPGLMLGAGMGVLGALLSAAGIWCESFTLFCLGGTVIGVYQASAMYYRFAALDAVHQSEKGGAAALVIGGGVCAAILAPTLATWSQGLSELPYLGAYLTMAVLAGVGVMLMAGLSEGVAPKPGKAGLPAMRALFARPVVRTALMTTLTGHGVMILVMTATPLAMSSQGLDVRHASAVIQWHVLGMFLPAFIAGPLVDRLGSRVVALAGLSLLATSAAVALSGEAKAAFLISSLLLGIGWNLTFVSGTTLLARGHADDERGNAQGLMELSNGLAATLAAFLAGALISGVGWTAINLGVLPLLVVAAVMLARLTPAPLLEVTPAPVKRDRDAA
ncbi:MAG: MFS transporter [Alteromonadaceae bacterium]|nr:MFS transporter [Alteromonadaceae bacterium]|tara:strand:+ start:564 stop:1775 length:1212 start_codon:yes stop_codon:yes gene_type:complete